jgi:hypothetical protein
LSTATVSCSGCCLDNLRAAVPVNPGLRADSELSIIRPNQQEKALAQIAMEFQDRY